jgi:hypothetical protein
MRRLFSLALVVIFVLGLSVGVAMAINDNPCNGQHYTLNVIGVPKDKTADMDGTHGHTIFVKLDGKSKIWLSEGDFFQVLDRNGTDNDGARFQLPAPDADDDGNFDYQVVARALGKPGGMAEMTTCYVDPNTGEDMCYGDVIELKRSKGRPHWQNVSKELLTVVICLEIVDPVTGAVSLECYTINLFDEDLEYFWSYDNNGLKLAQLRFYPACEL